MKPKKSFLQKLEDAIALTEEYRQPQFLPHDKRSQLYVANDLINEVLREHPDIAAIELLDADPQEAEEWREKHPVCGWAIVLISQLPQPQTTPPKAPTLTNLERLDRLQALGQSTIR